MSVTLKQIADAVGVSQPLVTYALNGKPGVSEATRQKILCEAERLGYDRSHNRVAQQMAARRHGHRVRTDILAVVCKFGEDADWPARQPSRSLLDGIENEAARTGLDLYITPWRQGSIPRLVKEGGVDGVLFVSQTGGLGPAYEGLDLPRLTVGSWNPSTYSLVPDDETGAYLATRHLMDLGHRSIGFVGLRHDFQAEARRAGYLRAHKERNRVVPSSLMETVSSVTAEEGRRALGEMRNANPAQGDNPGFTALLCQHDVLAMGAIPAAEALGLRVPEDLSVIGFDALSQTQQFRPTVTSVACDAHQMAKRALTWLTEEIDAYLQPQGGPWQPSSGVEKFPVQLRTGATTREWPPDSCAL